MLAGFTKYEIVSFMLIERSGLENNKTKCPCTVNINHLIKRLKLTTTNHGLIHIAQTTNTTLLVEQKNMYNSFL